MKVRPLHDRVLIKRIEEQETVRGGIIIPDTAKEKPQEAEVVAAGTGKRNDLQHYLNRPRVAGDTHGQAPMLWSANALLR